MITLKQILTVCNPDWIVVCGKTIKKSKTINTEKEGIPEGLLEFPVKEITGWDDGLTVELDTVIRPCTSADLAAIKGEHHEQL